MVNERQWQAYQRGEEPYPVVIRPKSDLVAELETPKPDVSGPVRCQECGAATTPSADWKCTICGRGCYYATLRGTCPRCSQPSIGIRTGYVWKSLCKCDWTPEQLAWLAQVRRQDETRTEQQSAAAHATRAGKDEKQLAAEINREASMHCWLARNQRCFENSKKLPFAYCKSCVRWVPVSKREPIVAAALAARPKPPHQVEMEELELEMFP